MSSSANTHDWLEGQFDPIDLKSLNAKAAMLERLDNKYVVNAAVLHSATPELANHFDILEIDGRRAFTYETCYFDGADLRSYFDHHQGRRRRAKVRMRAYKEAKLCFVEVKLKDKRGITVKKRMAYDLGKFGILDETALDHVQTSYRDLYHSEFPLQLRRVLDMRYVRMTLVAKEGGERMTIDSGLHFRGDGATHAVSENLFIVETKSANGNGLADRVLRMLHQHPTKHCSKYCAGIALTRAGTKHNKFRPALSKLRSMPATSGFRPALGISMMPELELVA
jgi:hypothetical protein